MAKRTDWRRLTGLKITRKSEAESFYEKHRKRGWPNFDDLSDENISMFRYIENAKDGESLPELEQRVENERASGERQSNPLRPVYGRKFLRGIDREDTFDHACAAAEAWVQVGDVEIEGHELEVSQAQQDVILRVAELVPLWSGIPLNHASDSAEFIWSRVTCAFGASHVSWRDEIIETMLQVYPNCPYALDGFSNEMIQKAHTSCGWPVHLTHLTWKDLVNTVDHTDEAFLEPWMKFVALVHVLKHVRVAQANNMVVVLYHSRAVRLEISTASNVIAHVDKTAQDIMHALGCPTKSGKKFHPLSVAVKWVLKHLTLEHYLKRQPLDTIKPNYIWGPWTHYEPIPSADGFFQHGLRLDGIKRAQHGSVLPYPGTDDEIMRYEWNVIDPESSKNIAARREVERSTPRHYEAAWPSDILTDAFPNLEFAEPLLDSVIVCGLLRREIPALRVEFPLLGFMPTIPTQDESTDQGKTACMSVVARALTPGLSTTPVVDSTSAPDQRAMADAFRRYDTMMIDEFRIPQSRSSFVNKENLVMLCNGEAIPSGLAFENGGEVKLRQPIAFEAKALDAHPDIYNRMVSFYLDQLTDDMRARTHVIDDIESGVMPMQMRLGAWALIEECDLLSQFNGMSHASKRKGLRFRCHRSMAILCHAIKHGEKLSVAGVEVDQQTTAMHDKANWHLHEAAETGILSAMRQNNNTVLHVTTFFDGIDDDRMYALEDILSETGNKDHTGIWFSPDALIRGILKVNGRENVAYGRAISEITGAQCRGTNRSILLAVNQSIKQLTSECDDILLRQTETSKCWTLHRIRAKQRIKLQLKSQDAHMAEGFVDLDDD